MLKLYLVNNRPQFSCYINFMGSGIVSNTIQHISIGVFIFATLVKNLRSNLPTTAPGVYFKKSLESCLQ